MQLATPPEGELRPSRYTRYLRLLVSGDDDSADYPTAFGTAADQLDAQLMAIAPDYGAPVAQMIQPLAGSRRGLVLKGGSYIRLDVPGVDPYPFIWSVPQDLTVVNAEQLLDTGSSFVPGRDYSVYTVLGGDRESAALAVSLNTTAPAGATAATSRKIGGFHTLCQSAGPDRTYVRGGQVVPHDLNGFAAGDILPLSLWDLKHRPRQDRTPPPGMVYERYLGFWVDIYLQSGTGPSTQSAFHGPIVHTREYVEHVEDMLCVGKVLLDDAEFAAAALGSPELVSVNGATQAAAQDGGAGGRSVTNGQRMLSYCGCEEMCGSMWQWLRTYGAGVEGQTILNTAAEGQPPAYAWVNMGSAVGPTAAARTGYGPYVQAGGKGLQWGVNTPLLAGGVWHNAAGSGSRARNGANSRSHASAALCGRGRESSGSFG